MKRIQVRKPVRRIALAWQVLRGRAVCTHANHVGEWFAQNTFKTNTTDPVTPTWYSNYTTVENRKNAG